MSQSTGAVIYNRTYGVAQPTATVATCSAVMGPIPQPTPNVNCFSKIQPAIDAAQANDVIKVGPGTYNEKLSINKKLTLTGASGSRTIVNAGGNSGIPGDNEGLKSVGTYGVTIDGFTFKNSSFAKAAIFLDRTTNFTVKNSKFIDNFYGIKMIGGTTNTLSNNIFTNTNPYGGSYAIILQNLEYTTFGNKTMCSNRHNIYNNNIVSPSDGIYLGENCDGNVLTGNTISAPRGMAVNIWGSDNNTLTGNTIQNSKQAVVFYGAQNNTLTSNNIVNNNQAFQVDAILGKIPSEGNVVNANNITGNTTLVKQGVGNGSSYFNVMNNWWGTTVESEITSKFAVTNINSILYAPYAIAPF
ncbi:MAG: right-handed parallel beta-helix repeat-containing protein [Candidatus Saccharibacteria bacterium]